MRSAPGQRPSTSVSVIGAGLGGATLALGLLQRGFRVRVYEQSPVLSEQGAGLTLPVVSMRVFDGLGLWPRVRDITVRQAAGTYVHYRTGQILAGKPDQEWLEPPRDPEQSGHTHRSALHRVLVDAIRELDPGAIVLDHRLEGLQQCATGVKATFANGEAVLSDVAVGCDGLRSVTSRLLFSAPTPRFTGVAAIRAMVPIDDKVRPFLTGGRFMNFIGPNRGFLRYGINKATLLNCVALVRTNRWTAEGWDNASSREELLELYSDFHEDVIGLIKNAPANAIFKWALYDREPLERWTSGRVTLLGDAAHPMLPFLGQGATTAIEDGYVLAQSMALHEDPLEAFAVYEAMRKPRTAAIMGASRAQGEALNQADPYAYVQLRPDTSAIQDYDPRTVFSPDPLRQTSIVALN